VRTTISSRGQTAVPAEVRRRFKLTGNSRLEWIIEGDVITLLPVPANPARAFRGTLKGKYSVAALLRGRARERRLERRRG
jgi:AbrB family looped-hinge helix DNA binding protein